MILPQPHSRLSSPTPTRELLGEIAFAHLESIVAVDSASDERSTTIPSTPGQRVLADQLAAFFRERGAEVEVDPHGNVIAALGGRGAGVGLAPVALMAHLDTARGTAALPKLHRLPRWDGSRVPYPGNDSLCVDVATYPATASFLGQTLVFGDGRAPFGLDDKLGLTHIMTLARLLQLLPAVDHPPLLLIARPDEEIGAMAAIEGLADELARRGVRVGWTIDGIQPFEINVENFYAAHASVSFAAERPAPAVREALRLVIGGVNTHGATAKAEAHRAATRFGVEILAALRADGLGDVVVPLAFASDALRDCDGVFVLGVLPAAPADAAARVAACAEAVVGPHRRRGASLSVAATTDVDASKADAVAGALALVARLIAEARVLPVLAEDSEGHEGYSHPYRIQPTDAGVALDVRLRDFDDNRLADRAAEVRALAPAGALVEVRQQYVNMGPRVQPVSALVALPKLAAHDVGVAAEVLPIRGGTGVDPFLDRGVVVANLGTGYFAPESEKELTSLELMADHARWLLALVQRLVLAGGDQASGGAS